MRHFHEKLGEEHQIGSSYTWVKQALQAAGLVKRKSRRGVHRKRRERRPLPGMMLHIDGSEHHWFQDERKHDLIVILDDATSDIYYAQLAPEESTFTVMAGLRAVIEQKGLFCSLYSDRGAHFWLTPKSCGKVDYERPAQVGRAMKELGVNSMRDLQVERESLFLDFSSQRLFHGLDLFLAQRRQELSFRAVVSDAMPSDHEGQRHVQMLVDDRLAAGQGMAPVGAFQLHDQIIEAHGVVPIDGALVALRKSHLQVPVPAGLERRSALGCGNREAAVEPGDVVLA